MLTIHFFSLVDFTNIKEALAGKHFRWQYNDHEKKIRIENVPFKVMLRLLFDTKITKYRIYAYPKKTERQIIAHRAKEPEKIPTGRTQIYEKQQKHHR